MSRAHPRVGSGCSSRSAAGTCCTPYAPAGGRGGQAVGRPKTRLLVGTRNPAIPSCLQQSAQQALFSLRPIFLSPPLPLSSHLFICSADLQGASSMCQVWFRPQGQMQIRNRALLLRGPGTPNTHTRIYMLTRAHPWSAEGFVPRLLPSLASGALCLPGRGRCLLGAPLQVTPWEAAHP